MQSPFGPVEITATPRGISRVRLLGRGAISRPCSNAPQSRCARRHIDYLLVQLRAYFDGQPVPFDVPLDLSAATPFQQRVWRACARIPYGQVRSYEELAETTGCPRAARAVGQAMSANQIPIVVPCHRVIRKDGSLGGYGLGIRLKKQLLRLEGAI